MSACATSDMNENIIRICKYFKVDDIGDIDKKVLPEFRNPSKNREKIIAYRRDLKVANNEKTFI